MHSIQAIHGFVKGGQKISEDLFSALFAAASAAQKRPLPCPCGQLSGTPYLKKQHTAPPIEKLKQLTDVAFAEMVQFVFCKRAVHEYAVREIAAFKSFLRERKV